MTLSVKPSQSIEIIKTQIHSLREIPVTHQTLKLNGVELKNEDTLSQHQIENCIIWLSYKPWQISIHIFEDWKTKKETIKLEVDWTEKIAELKDKIHGKKEIPTEWLNVYLGDGLWNEKAKLYNSESLADNKVFKKAMKEGLSLKISGEIRVYLDNLEPNQYRFIKVEAFETIAEIRTKIWYFSDCSKFFDSKIDNCFTLYKRDENLRLWEVYNDNKATVYDFGVKEFIAGQFIFTKNPDGMKYQIFVSMPKNNRLSIECYPFDTIAILKKKIQEKEGISYARLTYLGRPLEELGKTLYDYKIGKKSILNCRYEPLTTSMLAHLSPSEQKQMLGERLFFLIQIWHSEWAGKITGMLLENDNSELVYMLEHHESLKAKVEEAIMVLQVHKQQKR